MVGNPPIEQIRKCVPEDYGTVIEMVCRFVVEEFDRACIVRGKVIDPPPPPPPLVEPPQDARPAATAASSSINASGRANAPVL